MPNTILGKVSITPKGNYNIGTAYDRLDAVYDEATNASYLSLKGNNTDALTTGPSWMYLCRGIGATTDNNFTDAYKAMVDNAVPNTRAIAGSALSADITLSQLINAGLASGTGGKADTAATADNSLSLGGHEAGEYPIITSGAWTPTFSGGTAAGNPTYDYNSGMFVKIGKIIFFTMLMALTNKGGMSGYLWINGVPYTIQNSGISNAGSSFSCSNFSLSSGYIPSALYFASNSTFFGITALSNNGTHIFTANDISDTFAIQSCGLYFTN